MECPPQVVLQVEHLVVTEARIAGEAPEHRIAFLHHVARRYRRPFGLCFADADVGAASLPQAFFQELAGENRKEARGPQRPPREELAEDAMKDMRRRTIVLLRPHGEQDATARLDDANHFLEPILPVGIGEDTEIRYCRVETCIGNLKREKIHDLGARIPERLQAFTRAFDHRRHEVGRQDRSTPFRCDHRKAPCPRGDIDDRATREGTQFIKNLERERLRRTLAHPLVETDPAEVDLCIFHDWLASLILMYVPLSIRYAEESIHASPK